LLSCHGLRPRGALLNLPLSFKQYTAFQYEYTVGSPDYSNFGAQYLHSRYGLITPVYQLHTFGYPLVCGIGVRLAANLCLIRTLTGKNCQAFLAHTHLRDTTY